MFVNTVHFSYVSHQRASRKGGTELNLHICDYSLCHEYVWEPTNCLFHYFSLPVSFSLFILGCLGASYLHSAGKLSDRVTYFQSKVKGTNGMKFNFTLVITIPIGCLSFTICLFELQCLATEDVNDQIKMQRNRAGSMEFGKSCGKASIQNTTYSGDNNLDSFNTSSFNV